jgi:hypothetical protein
VTRYHLLREPQHVGYDESWWFYETNRGICIVVEPVIPGASETRQVTIGWARVRAALKRKDQPARRARRRKKP